MRRMYVRHREMKNVIWTVKYKVKQWCEEMRDMNRDASKTGVRGIYDADRCDLWTKSSLDGS